MSLFLTPADLRDLTGYQRAHDQIRWLRARAYIFELGGDGRPRLLRSYVEQRLGGSMAPPAPARAPRLRFHRA